MKPIVSLLSHLRSEGVNIALDGASLKISAPKGFLTPEYRQELAARKPEIVAFLRAAQAASLAGGSALTRVERGSSLPLSYAQQRIWFLHQLDGSSPAYNIPAAIRLNGVLDRAALGKTLAAIIARHEDLRTRFIQENGTPRAVIDSEQDWDMDHVDLQNLRDHQQESEVYRIAGQFVRQPFDLERGPLFRARLLTLATEHHVLVFSMHHIISDGWSMGVFVHELAENYRAFVENEAPNLPALTVQYADFAQWQRKWLESGELDRQLPYWQKQLAGAPPVVHFPTDHRRPRVETFRGRRSLVVLPANFVEDIPAFSRSAGVTSFMTLLAAFNILLYKYTGQSDLVVGTPSANRSRTELNPLIGFFVNNLVLRNYVDGSLTFRELVDRVREVTIKAYEHPDVPFDKLVQTLRPERTVEHSPLFQTMFMLQNFPFDELELPGLVITPLEIDVETARFDLTVEIYPRRGELRTYFEYNTELYEPETIATLQDHFITILRSVLADPSQRIDQIALLSESERRRQVESFNQTSRDIPDGICFHQRFEEKAHLHPNRVAVTCGDASLTYRALNDRANALAHHLQSAGAGPGTLVGICVDRSTDLLASLLAVLKTGAAYLPLDPIYPRNRISTILDDAQPRIVLTQQSNRELFVETTARVLCVESVLLASDQQPHPNPITSVTQEDLAYVIFTSGSTGRPKGVEIPHRALLNFLESMQRIPGFTQDDTLLAVTTVSFDIAALELFLPLYTGGHVHIATQAGDAQALLADLEVVKPTVMQATPATWQLLLSSGWAGSPNLKILCGGEALGNALAAALLDRSQSLWNMYGPTETTIWSAVYQVRGVDENPIPLGHPIQNTTFFVLDPAAQLVPIGVAGELCIGGEGVARGYLGRPELTAERFIADPFHSRVEARLYRTGDLVRYRRDGTLEFMGRLDHQVKLRGFRIELGEIEHALRSQPGIQDALVMLRENLVDKRLVAYVTTIVAEGSNECPSVSAIRDGLRESLPEYMVPSAFVFLAEFPQTPNGKLDRAALPEPGLTGTTAPFIAPSTSTQASVAAIFCGMLNVEQVSVHDNFFDLGAHSLMIVEVHERLRKEVAPNLKLVNFFQYPTIESLASFIESEKLRSSAELQLTAVSK